VFSFAIRPKCPARFGYSSAQNRRSPTVQFKRPGVSVCPLPKHAQSRRLRRFAFTTHRRCQPQHKPRGCSPFSIAVFYPRGVELFSSISRPPEDRRRACPFSRSLCNLYLEAQECPYQFGAIIVSAYSVRFSSPMFRYVFCCLLYFVDQEKGAVIMWLFHLPTNGPFNHR
jgi:hypothetical protein